MILALLLAQAAPVAPPPDPEVVVIAQRMRMIAVDLKAPKRDGKLTLQRCRVTRSSGFAELDAIPCAVAQECVAAGVGTRNALEDCVEARSVARVNAVAAMRRAVR